MIFMLYFLVILILSLDCQKVWSVDYFNFSFAANKPCIILGTLETVREGFLTKGNDFANRPTSYTCKY